MAPAGRRRPAGRPRPAVPVAVLGPLVVQARPGPAEPALVTVAGPELTTVADDEAVVHNGLVVDRWRGLDPATGYRFGSVSFTTLPRPGGERLATVATVNDVHFGEEVAGLIEGTDIGPVFTSGPGEDPYPEVMNRGAIGEITAVRPDAVVAKGDLTADGTREQFDAFLAAYGEAFGDRLHWVRGNHDVTDGAVAVDDGAPFAVDLPGVRLAVIDTSIPGRATGRVTADDLDWLDTAAAESDRPVLVFGHHHPWNPDGAKREAEYFGINPDDSEALVAVVARRPAIVGYFAGHTHRNRVRRFGATGDVPWVEVACVKDYPGSWAEYRVFEGGILQVHRRISTPEALRWSERTKAMYGGLYRDYAFGALEDRCFAIGLRERTW
jgi:3',5'-cyclic-AMP phosphodiesterase